MGLARASRNALSPCISVLQGTKTPTHGPGTSSVYDEIGLGESGSCPKCHSQPPLGISSDQLENTAVIRGATAPETIKSLLSKMFSGKRACPVYPKSRHDNQLRSVGKETDPTSRGNQGANNSHNWYRSKCGINSIASPSSSREDVPKIRHKEKNWLALTLPSEQSQPDVGTTTKRRNSEVETLDAPSHGKHETTTENNGRCTVGLHCWCLPWTSCISKTIDGIMTLAREGCFLLGWHKRQPRLEGQQASRTSWMPVRALSWRCSRLGMILGCYLTIRTSEGKKS